ncbi:MAG: hypothetical protein KAH14_10655 [Clostridiales bacterium]|nr:hypothetical protein [Clostridiales bacterium]
MKKIFLILLTAILSLFLIGCGIFTNENSNLTSNNALDSSDSNVIVEEIELSWPTDKLSKSVPKLKNVTITNIEDIENGVLITFKDCDQTDVKKYINLIKNAGWEMQTTNTEAGKTVTAEKQEESLIFFASEDGTGSITYKSKN